MGSNSSGGVLSDFFFFLALCSAARVRRKWWGWDVMGRTTRNGIYKPRNRRRRTSLVRSTIQGDDRKEKLVNESLSHCIDVT